MATPFRPAGDRSSDHLLMERLASGDESAMDDLVARWQRPALACAQRFLGCGPEEAQDVAQEAFLRVWRERSRFKPRAAFSTWLFTVVLNLCRNRLRTLRRRPALVALSSDDSESCLELPASTSDDPYARARGSEMERRVRRALAALPENQRAAILLRRFEDMSYREISAVLGVSESAVESLLVRARRSLEAALVEPAQGTEASGVSPEGEA